MKKFFKVLAAIGAVFTLFLIGGLIYFFNQLPSIKDIGSTLRTRNTALDAGQAPAAASVPVVAEAQAVQSLSGDVSTTETPRPMTPEERAANTDLLQDLTSAQSPISDFCGSLKYAKDGTFDQKQFGQAFSQSMNSDQKDPRIQAVKPMLRYVMRLPKMTEMMADAEAAVERNDETFLQKAEFYTKAVSAFAEMKEHKSDIESVMDRSYLLLGLNKLVAQKPELLNDSRIQNYCNNVELAFNQAVPVDFESEKKDFLKFLSDVNVQPKDIGFNPSYKSDIQFNFSGQAMTFEGGWLSDLVQSDVEIDPDAAVTQ